MPRDSLPMHVPSGIGVGRHRLESTKRFTEGKTMRAHRGQRRQRAEAHARGVFDHHRSVPGLSWFTPGTQADIQAASVRALASRKKGRSPRWVRRLPVSMRSV